VPTLQEIATVKMWAGNIPTRRIAEISGVSEKTIESRLVTFRRKLRIKSPIALVHYALKHKLVEFVV
jgi:DNA-binding NarL/FixJ family response regulator